MRLKEDKILMLTGLILAFVVFASIVSEIATGAIEKRQSEIFNKVLLATNLSINSAELRHQSFVNTI